MSTFLLTVHGANSDNEGFKKLRDACEEAVPDILVDSFFYGNVRPFKELTDSTRQVIFRTLRDRLQTINQDHLLPNKERKLVIVAHSFGTLAIVRALEMGVPNLSIHGLILLGSIVPRDQYWTGLVNSGYLASPPLAIIRPFDRIVRHGRLVGGGSSGSDGFIPTGMYRPREIFKNGGHTDYHPDDFADIISVIKHGATSLPRKSETTWLGEQSTLKRVALSVKRMIF